MPCPPTISRRATCTLINRALYSMICISCKISYNNRPVPQVPSEITGPCIYGHILTEEHIANFHRHHSDIPEWEISDFESLISIASILVSTCHIARTAHVYDDQGEERECLMLVGHRNRSRLNDWRWDDGFMTDMVNALGITGEPKWYACRRR